MPACGRARTGSLCPACVAHAKEGAAIYSTRRVIRGGRSAILGGRGAARQPTRFAAASSVTIQHCCGQHRVCDIVLVLTDPPGYVFAVHSDAVRSGRKLCMVGRLLFGPAHARVNGNPGWSNPGWSNPWLKGKSQLESHNNSSGKMVPPTTSCGSHPCRPHQRH